MTQPDGVTVHLTEREALLVSDILMTTAYRHLQSGDAAVADPLVDLRNKIVTARHDALADDDTQTAPPG